MERLSFFEQRLRSVPFGLGFRECDACLVDLLTRLREFAFALAEALFEVFFEAIIGSRSAARTCGLLQNRAPNPGRRL